METRVLQAQRVALVARKKAAREVRNSSSHSWNPRAFFASEPVNERWKKLVLARSSKCSLFYMLVFFPRAEVPCLTRTMI
jgi:hypothetical protein